MVTVLQGFHMGPIDLVGLSTDTKPTDIVDGKPVKNGSTFIEMDTGHVYWFNADAGSWIRNG